MRSLKEESESHDRILEMDGAGHASHLPRILLSKASMILAMPKAIETRRNLLPVRNFCF